MSLEVVAVEGGSLDGMVGEIAVECSELGFFIQSEQINGEEYWVGYYDHGETDREGRRIFRRGRPSGRSAP